MAHKKMQTNIAKKVKAIIALLMLFSAVCAVPASLAENSSGLPRIMVIPKRIVDPTLRPGKNFNISIYTDYDGWDVTAYQFTLSYDPNILHGGIQKTDWDAWTGDNVTKTFNATKKRIVPHSEEVYVDDFLMTRYTERTDTWTGDGVTTSFITTEKPVVPKSEMIYVNKSYAKPNEEYLIDHTAGNITFFTAPEDGAQIEVEYTYGHYNIEYKTGEIAFTTAPALGAEVKARYLYGGVVNGDIIVNDPPIRTSAKFIPGAFNNTEGKLSLTVGLFVEEGEFNTGPGTLANVTFTVVGRGKSNITLGPQTKLFGWDIFAWPPHAYVIIDAETMPDQIQHGFFANVGSGSSADGGATTEAKGYVDEIANELEGQSEASLLTLHIAVPQVTVGWYPYWKNWGLPLWKDATKPGKRWLMHWEIAYAIMDDLAKIGINVVFHWIDKYSWMDITGDGDHTKTCDEGGWDMALLGWDATPTDLLGYKNMYTGGRCSCHPDGYNYFDWNNEAADYYLEKGMSELDATTRKFYLGFWQEEFMHDPPLIPLYYLEAWDVTTTYLEGWDPVVGWADGWNLRINTTLFDAVAPFTRKVIGSNTLLWGSRDQLGNLNPLFAWNSADLVYAAQAFETLMKLQKDPETGGYKVVPWLTNGSAIYSADGKDVTVYLRNDVLWHDHPDFANRYYLNNNDVKLTFDALMNFGYGGYTDIIDSVEANTQDTLKVVFHLNKAYPAFDSLLSQTHILPRHFLAALNSTYGYDWYKWWTDETNVNPKKRMPGTGPFKLVDKEYEYWEMAANTEYWNWTSEPMIDRIYGLYMLGDPVSNFIGLQCHDFDFGDCWATCRDVMQWIIDGDGTWYGLKAMDDRTPTLDYLAFNLNHDKLSNRYVRQAIAHAINYPYIRNYVIEPYPYKALPGKAPIFPIQQYTDPNGQTVRFFNENLPPYEYSITKAQQYLDMWYYSQVGKNYTKGPIGDADLGGDVRIHDFPIWVDNIGTTSADWTFLPGRDIDPDFDNNNYVEADDFLIWRANRGEEYPFSGAR